MLLQCAAIIWGLIGLGWLAAYSGSDIGVKSFFVTYRRVQVLLLFFLVVQEVDTVEEAKRLLLVTIFASAAVSIIGLLQFADIGPVRELLYRFYTIPETGRTHGLRVTATFDSHANALGAYYVIILSMATAVIAWFPRKFLNPAWCGILVLGCVALFATASRASLLALGIGVFVVAVMRRIWLLGVIVPPVAVSLYFAGGRMTERLVALYEAVAYGRIETHHSLGQHLRHWSFALERIESMPFVGYGYGGDDAIALNRYLDNYYLYLIYHEGYISLAIFLALLTVILLTLYRIATRPGDDLVRAGALGLFAATIGLSAHAVGADTFTWERVAMVLWLCLALVIRADSLLRDEGEDAAGTTAPSIRDNTGTNEIAPAEGGG
jgi:O-antigen ligase